MYFGDTSSLYDAAGRLGDSANGTRGAHSRVDGAVTDLITDTSGAERRVAATFEARWGGVSATLRNAASSAEDVAHLLQALARDLDGADRDWTDASQQALAKGYAMSGDGADVVVTDPGGKDDTSAIQERLHAAAGAAENARRDAHAALAGVPLPDPAGFPVETQEPLYVDSGDQDLDLAVQRVTSALMRVHNAVASIA